MNTQDFSQDILAKIEERHMAPRPRWQVVFVRVLWWLMAVVALLLGGLAFASVLFFAREQLWDALASQVGGGDVLRLVPLFWIMLFLALAYGAYRELRATPRGYRYEASFLVVGVFIGSMTLGGLVCVAGYEALPHEFLRDRLPGYETIVPDPPMAWHRPTVGRYAGIVLSTTTQGFVLKDLDGAERVIEITSTTRWLLPVPLQADVRIKTVCTRATSSEALFLIEARPAYRTRRPVLERALDRRVELRHRAEELRERLNDRREDHRVPPMDDERRPFQP